MRKLVVVLALLGGVFVWTGCPDQGATKGGSSSGTGGTDASAPVGSK